MVVDAYNVGLGQRKAIYKYFPQGIPSVFTIDAPNCRQLGQGKKCGVCAKVCQAKAIDYEQKDQEVEIEAGAIILATGYEVFDPSVIPEYGYDRIANVVTAMELERLLSASGPTAGHLDRPSDIAMEHELEDLEKEHKKLSRQVKQLEEKCGKTSQEASDMLKACAVIEGIDLKAWWTVRPEPNRWKSASPSSSKGWRLSRPPRSWPSFSVSDPGISDSTGSARPTAACTPSRRP
jgi:heterodisulfide reductase subunit A